MKQKDGIKYGTNHLRTFRLPLKETMQISLSANKQLKCCENARKSAAFFSYSTKEKKAASCKT